MSDATRERIIHGTASLLEARRYVEALETDARELREALFMNIDGWVHCRICHELLTKPDDENPDLHGHGMIGRTAMQRECPAKNIQFMPPEPRRMVMWQGREYTRADAEREILDEVATARRKIRELFPQATCDPEEAAETIRQIWHRYDTMTDLFGAD